MSKPSALSNEAIDRIWHRAVQRWPIHRNDMEALCAMAKERNATLSRAEHKQVVDVLARLEMSDACVDPPLVTVSEVVRLDIAINPAGITLLDSAYDEHLAEMLSPTGI